MPACMSVRHLDSLYYLQMGCLFFFVFLQVQWVGSSIYCSWVGELGTWEGLYRAQWLNSGANVLPPQSSIKHVGHSTKHLSTASLEICTDGKLHSTFPLGWGSKNLASRFKVQTEPTHGSFLTLNAWTNWQGGKVHLWICGKYL